MPKMIKYQKGDKIGPYNIEFIRSNGIDKYHHQLGIFICPYCGNEFNAIISKIKSGIIKSCKCKRRLRLQGKKFGKLTAIEPIGTTNSNHVI